MSRAIRWLAACLAVVVILACGGGGAGGGGAASGSIVGRVLSIETGAAPNPRPTVRIPSASVVVEADGSFALAAPTGTSRVTVETNSAWGDHEFTFLALSDDSQVDIGDLWVGPATITLKGRVLSSATDLPVEAATVSFAGRSGQTNVNGVFQLPGVAYSSASQAVFWGIAGKVSALDFFSTEFSSQPNVAIAGVVDVGDVRMTPLDDINPPPPPFNIWGRVTPTADAPGTIATLKLNGTPVRIYNVSSDGKYRFWVPPGSYTIELVKGPLTGTATATLTATNEVIRRDITLQ